MAQLVVQRHTDAAEAGAAEPGAVLRGRARGFVRRVLDDDRKRGCKGADALEGEEGGDGVRVVGVQGLDCDGILLDSCFRETGDGAGQQLAPLDETGSPDTYPHAQ